MELNRSTTITPLSPRRFIPHLPRPADYTSHKNDYCNNHFIKVIIAIIILFKHRNQRKSQLLSPNPFRQRFSLEY